MKVKIKNFQSIEDASLEIKGFTVIVGRSNIGKSAIVRSIEGALTNLGGDAFVRMGEHHTEVELETDTLNLKWTKGGGLNDYEINGVEYQSVGRGSPPAVAEAGFKDVEVSRGSVSVQVASQFNPIFLLDPSQISGSLAAEVVSDVGRLGELQEALRNAGKDKRSLENVQRVRRKDLLQVNEDLSSYDDLDSLNLLYDNLQELKADIQELKEEISSYEEVKLQYEEALQALAHYEGASDVVVPDWDGDKSVKRIEALEAFRDVYTTAVADLNTYSGVEYLALPDWEGDSILKSLQSLGKFRTHYQAALEILQNLTEIPALPREPDWESLKTQALESLIEDRDLLKRTLPELESEVASLDLQIQEAHEEFHDLLAQSGICPLCERDTHD